MKEWFGYGGIRRMNAYMTVEAAMVMSVVLVVYVFLIHCMLYQYERCVNDLETGRNNVHAIESVELQYKTKQVDPVLLLRLQRMITQKQKEEKGR